MKDFSILYDNAYFDKRKSNDKKRMISFEKEKVLLEKFVNFNGNVCDVGCSTGEFLQAIKWQGPKFGMEINGDAMELARASGISFERDLFNTTNYFDLIVFRGTIQHLPDPFGYIHMAYEALKKGGYIVFLATPNANSAVYKFFNTLPALNSQLNFYIPSNVTLSNILKNNEFEVLEIERPYLNSPYANPILDHIKFIYCLITRKKPNFAFWGNMMNIIARKN
jgi:SAM-dependent methyltransferase